jgi:adenylosuccinate lyase
MADASIPNVLAARYASAAMKSIWSAEGRVRVERDFWIAIMKAQRALGIDIPEEAIAAYTAARDNVDLESIARRERVTRHDVKARIDEFCALAGHEHVHKGMTSRDLTENVEQLQVFRSLELIRIKTAAAMLRIAARAEMDAAQPVTARTHNVPAQLTTVGKRWAMFGEELAGAFVALDNLINTYPVRGIKGAVGTQLDQLRLFDRNAALVDALEREILRHLGMTRTFTAVGQVYPRSLDLRVVACLCDLASAPASFATTLRLMAGHELAGEGFAEGQTGSSAMPHKMNTRSCERLNGLHIILKGHLTMAAALAGTQWNEGDVSCSVVRRVVLPDAFFAVDGLFETFLTVLDQMEICPALIDREIDRYLPFLLSTTFLMEAVKRGVGRETAHRAVKRHALDAVRARREGSSVENDFVARLAADPELRLSRDEITAILDQGRHSLGAAAQQTHAVVESLRAGAAGFPEAATLKPDPIL